MSLILIFFIYYIKWGFESRLKHKYNNRYKAYNYIKWGFESRLKLTLVGEHSWSELYQMGI